MSKEDNGGPAFPEARIAGEQGDYWTEHTSGMALRDYFAAKAMQGILSNVEQFTTPGPEYVAEESYKIADAMLEARKK